MKVISYVGAECPTIVIEKTTDLFPALDVIQSRMLELSEMQKDPDKRNEFEQCADLISKLMDQVELNGYGSQDDIDNIEWR